MSVYTEQNRHDEISFTHGKELRLAKQNSSLNELNEGVSQNFPVTLTGREKPGNYSCPEENGGLVN